MSETSSRVRRIIVKTLKLDETSLPSSLEVDSVPAWDSLGHITLMVCLQEEFGIDIPLDKSVEMLSENNIVTTVDQILNKTR